MVKPLWLIILQVQVLDPLYDCAHHNRGKNTTHSWHWMFSPIGWPMLEVFDLHHGNRKDILNLIWGFSTSCFPVSLSRTWRIGKKCKQVKCHQSMESARYTKLHPLKRKDLVVAILSSRSVVDPKTIKNIWVCDIQVHQILCYFICKKHFPFAGDGDPKPPKCQALRPSPLLLLAFFVKCVITV